MSTPIYHPSGLLGSPFIFEENGLYILLSDRGDKSYTFHWGLYLHQATSSGFIYHLVNTVNSTTWRFEPKPNQNIANSQGLLVALKIGVLDSCLHQHFLDRLYQVPIADSVRFRERITCRVWLKEALHALDEEGYIKLTRSVNVIETEATTLAIQNKSLGRRMVARSNGSQV
ncbi:putative Cytochrome P450 monooxygenase [Penicillium digitatum]|uniref:Uncharacterized protein n=3 Tax=Penicillium digitatum TaxID=36651 RepID=K9F9I9_PEND2|nr:hypothetical protein PDIP_28290 [Penicillium digitatum Pd1]EKV05794.1 hypothetical protein PDIG_79910 [Penicillium digitatum PHI26]EKV18129.1 hypothetical protein PDIP_28290 [Penicillium digitatum Pd1]KAG0155019.1 hypothetical protein PDIDSM_592 [Penicillium digitatum]QQK47076.1 putative Cytochrome P450 monooxygenase [Penicillium digitatum]